MTPRWSNRSLSFAGLLSFALLGPIACKSEEGIPVSQYVEQFAETACEGVIACECDYPYGALYEHCVNQLGVNGDALAELNSVDGLSFDGECADQAIKDIRLVGCTTPVGDPNAACEQPCKLWYGPMGRGATCTSVNGYDNCDQGLVCSSEVCVNPCDEPNLPTIGEACAPNFGCTEGAYCDDQTTPLTPTCAALPSAGQPCGEIEFGYVCAEDSFCDVVSDPAPTCVALPRLGEECPSFECAAGLYCDPSGTPAVCAAVPTLGEDCPFGSCAAPYYCDGEVCVEPPPAICGFYGGLPPDEGSTDTTTGTTDTGTTDTTDTSGACNVDEFECGSGECIPLTWLCDSASDCADGSDELTCP